MSLSPEQLQHFVDELVAAPEVWREHIRHDGDARVYAEIWSDEDVNAWLICWSEDQDTGFHDHDQSGAAIAVIDGQVREDRLRLAAEPSTRVIGPGETFFVAPAAIHRVLHAGGRPAVTIHAYSPPLTRTGAYRIGPGGELEREALSHEEELRAELALGELALSEPALS
jgi:predicted metal-dependent enzyme (double-stranded beta helix superfamily)